MLTPEIEEFAKILVQQVRDAAIRSCDRDLQPDAQSSVARRWKEAARDGIPQELVKMVISDVVDETIANLLLTIDQELLPMSYTASNGNKVNLVEEGRGELSGWYGGSPGWRTLYTSERFADDYSDLRGFFDP